MLGFNFNSRFVNSKCSCDRFTFLKLTMSSQYPPASQTSSDIVKAIKRSFIGAAPPMYRGEKVVRRTDTNIALKRNTDHWKGDFYRRTRQKSEGFFSSMAQPYEELGETELDTEKLVTDALRDIGGVFGYEVS